MPLKVMATPPAQVIMDFPQLLLTITDALGFPKPKCRILDTPTNNTAVIVKTNCSKTTHVFLGGEANSIEETSFSASQKAVKELMGYYGVSVEDITSNKWLELQRCASLYRLKKKQLSIEELGCTDTSLNPCRNTFLSKENYDSSVPGTVQVSVDYISIPRTVYKQFKVEHSIIESVETAQGIFEAWCTITPQARASGFDLIVGDPCSERMLSKQNVARKVIAYLMPLCNFEVIDANYDPYETIHQTLLCNLEKEGCLVLRDVALKSKKALIRSDAAPETREKTPTNSESRIPPRNSPPPVSKKRPHEDESSSYAGSLPSKDRSMVFFKPPDDLEQAFKQHTQKNQT